MTAIVPGLNWAAHKTAIYVDSYGADPTGATFSDTAFANAITAGGSAFILVAGTGTYKLANSYVFARNQGLIGQGGTLTTFNYTGSGTLFSFYDATFSSSASNAAPVGGFYVSGYTAGAGAIGVRWGNLNKARVNDLAIAGFNTTGGIGLSMKNDTSCWSEQGVWNSIELIDNSSAVVFDTGSFDYSEYHFHIVANNNQHGVLLQNNAKIEGASDLTILGNFNGGTSNTGVVLGIDKDGAGTGTSRIDAGRIVVSVECDGATGTGHTSIKMGGGSASKLTGVGVLSFLDLTIPFVGANIGGSVQFGLAGTVIDNNLGKMTDSSAATFYGGTYRRQTGGFSSGSSVSFASNNMTIFTQYGDMRFLQLINGVVNISTLAGVSNVGKAGKKLDLFVKQPSSGGAGSLTWTPTVKWAGGSSTLSATSNAVDLIELWWSPTENMWFGKITLNFA
jgi:hypothetical protein